VTTCKAHQLFRHISISWNVHIVLIPRWLSRKSLYLLRDLLNHTSVVNTPDYGNNDLPSNWQRSHSSEVPLIPPSDQMTSSIHLHGGMSSVCFTFSRGQAEKSAATSDGIESKTETEVWCLTISPTLTLSLLPLWYKADESPTIPWQRHVLMLWYVLSAYFPKMKVCLSNHQSVCLWVSH
jgi:hypothetical protein